MSGFPTPPPVDIDEGLSVLNYGAKGNGSDDSAALAAAAAAAGTTGTMIFPPGYTFTFATPQVWKCNVAGWGAQLHYTGSSFPAITLIGDATATGYNGSSELFRYRYRSAFLPILYTGNVPSAVGTDVGVAIVLAEYSRIEQQECAGFSIGWLVTTHAGTAKGTQFADFFLPSFESCPISLKLAPADANGWVNDNKFYSGRCPGLAGVTGNRGLLIPAATNPVNNNDFLGTGFESFDCTEYRVECYGRDNRFLQNRWEASPGPKTITNKALTSNVATLTTSSAHGYSAGQGVGVTLLGAPFDTRLSTILATPTSTSFTYAVVSGDVASTPTSGRALVGPKVYFGGIGNFIDGGFDSIRIQITEPNDTTAYANSPRSDRDYALNGFGTADSEGRGGLFRLTGVNAGDIVFVIMPGRYDASAGDPFADWRWRFDEGHLYSKLKASLAAEFVIDANDGGRLRWGDGTGIPAYDTSLKRYAPGILTAEQDFYVQGSILLKSGQYLLNASSGANGRISLVTGSPIFLDRNVADAVAAVQSNNAHLSNTGNIHEFLNHNGLVAAIDHNGKVTWVAANEQATVGAAGAASALPATPAKYLKITDSTGATLVIPAYAAA